eukprot:6200079-Pleurochrysis_carterae.AAC.1
MHPEYGQKFCPVRTPWMLAKEFDCLRGGELAMLASGSKKGATLSYITSLLASIRRAEEDGLLVNTAAAGTGEFCVRTMVAGDGFRAGASKEVRIGVNLLTTKSLNQSPNDWSDFCLYAGDESYASIKSFLEPVLGEIAALNASGTVCDDNVGQTDCVKLSLGGDLPWLLALLGKRNMSFKQGFSPYCLCPHSLMNDFDLEDHTLLTAEIAAMLTHTSPAAAHENAEHEDFECP